METTKEQPTDAAPAPASRSSESRPRGRVIPLPGLPALPRLPALPHLPALPGIRQLSWLRPQVKLPSRDKVLLYTGLGAMAAIDLIDWPVAAAIAMATVLTSSGSRSQSGCAAIARSRAWFGTCCSMRVRHPAAGGSRSSSSTSRRSATGRKTITAASGERVFGAWSREHPHRVSSLQWTIPVARTPRSATGPSSAKASAYSRKSTSWLWRSCRPSTRPTPTRPSAGGSREPGEQLIHGGEALLWRRAEPRPMRRASVSVRNAFA